MNSSFTIRNILKVLASRRHGGLYYYYHCSSACGTRFKSDTKRKREIFNLGEGFRENKQGQISKKTDLSFLVARPGFEPRQSDPETDVLPLYYRAIMGGKTTTFRLFSANLICTLE